MESGKKVFLSAGVFGALGWLASDVLAFTRKRADVTGAAAPDAAESGVLSEPARPGMPDLTLEMARLVEFAGKIGMAIRQQTVDAPRDDDAAVSTDLGEQMWLIDCLQHLAMLGQAVRTGTPQEIISRCDDILRHYRDYRMLDTMHQRLTRAVPDATRFSLTGAMAVFSDIKAKMLPLTHAVQEQFNDEIV